MEDKIGNSEKNSVFLQGIIAVDEQFVKPKEDSRIAD
jgi:hypothetical protein